MNYYQKIIEHLRVVKARWIDFTWNTPVSTNEKSSPPKSVLTNTDNKNIIRRVAKLFLKTLYVLTIYPLVALYFIVVISIAAPIFIIEKFISGVKFILSKFMSPADGNPTAVATKISFATENQLVEEHKIESIHNKSTITSQLDAEAEQPLEKQETVTTLPVQVTTATPEDLKIAAEVTPHIALEIEEEISTISATPSPKATSPGPNITVGTQLVVYKPHLLIFTNDHAATLAINNQRLLEKLKREHGLWSKMPIVSLITTTESKTDDHVYDFIQNNKKNLILNGINLLENENFLSEESYKGLYNKINLKDITKNDNSALNSQKRLDYLAAILCIAWALSDLSKGKGFDVSRGSYAIINNDAIYKFFLGYVNLITGSTNPGYFFSNSSLVYGRNPDNKLSSHYKNDKNQYGIDMRLEESGESFDILPHKHSHILFGLIESAKDVNSTFIKFEPHGMGTFFDLISHGVDFVNSGTLSGKTHREKDVPQVFENIYSEFCNLTNQPNNAKYIKDMYNKMSTSISTNLKPEQSNKEYKNDWQDVNLDINQNIFQLFKKFKEAATNYKWDLNSLQYRFGEEVHISNTDLTRLDTSLNSYKCNMS